ncbi:DUF3426 domain-containing protein [Hydrogenophaga sp. RWCD_12]|uniref:DUF3426 domain-containing protein n=1 Tax=Hydrogenophaga sp. RWCD_12 TaxID=3391190 RepID=UPI003984E792
MSFTTRCPACGTTFKIVPDQLKISDGWVRCGHCADVFDATLFLEGERPVPEPAAAPVVPAPSAPAQEMQPSVPAPSRKVVISAPVTQPPGDGDDGWLLRPRQAEAPAAAPQGPRSVPGMNRVQADRAFEEEIRRFAVSTTSEALPPLPSPAPSAPLSDEPPANPSSVERDQAGPSGDSLPAPTAPAPDDKHETEPPLLEPSFVVQARRRAFWQSRGTRAALWVASLALVLGLLLQIAVHERDRLAAWSPATGALLMAVCRPVGCEVGPARQIESVVIDSSNLVRRLGNFYSFDLVLKNSASFAVAMPALELSLTDTRDAVIVRRVFLPDELPGAPQLLPPQGALSLSLRLSIADQGVSSMSGYRALVFYP